MPISVEITPPAIPVLVTAIPRSVGKFKSVPYLLGSHRQPKCVTKALSAIETLYPTAKQWKIYGPVTHQTSDTKGNPKDNFTREGEQEGALSVTSVKNKFFHGRFAPPLLIWVEGAIRRHRQFPKCRRENRITRHASLFIVLEDALAVFCPGGTPPSHPDKLSFPTTLRRIWMMLKKDTSYPTNPYRVFYKSVPNKKGICRRLTYLEALSLCRFTSPNAETLHELGYSPLKSEPTEEKKRPATEDTGTVKPTKKRNRRIPGAKPTRSSPRNLPK